MPDITMCTSMSCPMAEQCYRSKAFPDPLWQSWSNFEYTCNENSGFNDFISMYEDRLSNKNNETN